MIKQPGYLYVTDTRLIRIYIGSTFSQQEDVVQFFISFQFFIFICAIILLPYVTLAISHTCHKVTLAIMVTLAIITLAIITFVIIFYFLKTLWVRITQRLVLWFTSPTHLYFFAALGTYILKLNDRVSRLCFKRSNSLNTVWILRKSVKIFVHSSSLNYSKCRNEK